MAAVIRPILNFLDTNKQLIKNTIGYFSIGAVPAAIYDLFKFNGAGSFPALTGNISIILNGAVSPVGIAVISTIVHRFFIPEKLETIFGKNTIFAINPWHPRHAANVAAIILMTPTVLKEAHSLYRRATKQEPPIETEPQLNPWLSKVVIVNFVFSRVVLHVVNQGLQSYFKKAA